MESKQLKLLAKGVAEITDNYEIFDFSISKLKEIEKHKGLLSGTELRGQINYKFGFGFTDSKKLSKLFTTFYNVHKEELKNILPMEIKQYEFLESEFKGFLKRYHFAFTISQLKKHL